MTDWYDGITEKHFDTAMNKAIKSKIDELLAGVEMPEPVLYMHKGELEYVAEGGESATGFPKTDGITDDKEFLQLVTLDQCQQAVAAAVARKDAEIAELRDIMVFIERWANHHASKPHMDAEQALSVIQHHPAIKTITKQYADGKVPQTRDPYAELETLTAERDALREALELAMAHGSFEQGSGVIHNIRAALGTTP